MNTKFLLPLIILIALAVGGAWWLTKNSTAPAVLEENVMTSATAKEVSDGTYEVVAAESEVMWAGKKPLIDGYINSGSIAISEGTITRAGTNVSGMFTIDMNTLSVSSTPKKPGAESALESHLKGERWFDVAAYPTAAFVIVSVAPRVGEEHSYDVTGNLTMKGQTHEVSFPAEIYQDAQGRVHASAQFEIDRTKWGITSGSASFFDNLADNAIDDMVALSLTLVAK